MKGVRNLKQPLLLGACLLLPLSLGVWGSLYGDEEEDHNITDVHFHPCSFSHNCVPLDRLVDEMDATGVTTSWVFGLQHQMLRDPGDIADWPSNNRCELTSPMVLPEEPDLATCQQIHAELVESGERPFHYSDPCAKPGWPLAPNDEADQAIFSQYQELSPEKKERIRPFLSYLNFDTPCAQTEAGENANLAYVKAMDQKYPGAIFGFAEHNLNKQVLFTHNVCRPDLNQWHACSDELMAYIAETRRPLGIHFDLLNDRGTSFEDLLIDFATAYPDVIMIWQHGGVAPEVTDRLTAEAHIAALERFLATSPGKRYVGLSWTNGFFRRLNADEMEEDQFGWPIERNSEADKAAYLLFMENNKQAVLFGSDQVSLFYGDTTVLDTKLHNAYEDGYKRTIETEKAVLRALVGSMGDWAEEGAAWKAIMHANADRIIEQIDWSKVAGYDGQ